MELSLLESRSFKKGKSDFGLGKLKALKNGLKRRFKAVRDAGK